MNKLPHAAEVSLSHGAAPQRQRSWAARWPTAVYVQKRDLV